MKVTTKSRDGIWYSRYQFYSSGFDAALFYGGSASGGNLLHRQLNINNICTNINDFDQSNPHADLPLYRINGTLNILNRSDQMEVDRISDEVRSLLRGTSIYKEDPSHPGNFILDRRPDRELILNTIYLFHDQFTNKVDLFSRLVNQPGDGVPEDDTLDNLNIEDLTANPYKLGPTKIETNIVKAFEKVSGSVEYQMSYLTLAELKYRCKYLRYDDSMNCIGGGIKSGSMPTNGIIEVPNTDTMSAGVRTKVYNRIMSVILFLPKSS